MKTCPNLTFTRDPATGGFSYDPAAMALAKQWLAQLKAEYAANPLKHVVDAIEATLLPPPTVTVRVGDVEGTGTTWEEAAADFSQKTGGRYTLHFGQNHDPKI